MNSLVTGHNTSCGKELVWVGDDIQKVDDSIIKECVIVRPINVNGHHLGPLKVLETGLRSMKTSSFLE
ncbi:hypothetical protein FOXG_21368 [Fusarium oxysporum f. sp. lycopersici 4287]|uniref:Uncharacterized protein n=1 Tax=Fusarium oxysporum f. sp. lycopersici (strain 4287 / CBS 123668 / FGSC 9935 / NRRL 34936) TaxID=426428 RepID=A0A0J9VXN5_FUSO4|nr:hypothetical protein FOXG_20939 [Fusarium oxysporum f. sp. lycopersici 4287]XP_018253576.1 hypothetical protein FOXG_21368 [Fusarium oxysporum f. sp. lycopersici 4287]EWZ79176.1 hypothetical protein FOWG_16627 [Fusarium oxysporum f. sp. lycopersici MN25]KNB13829.1 hypothetical protein FOXG_20939 [Fusarium oxysporum f. sp. lycopersici 4287]KNB15531.1 hypothetical protein FOXG_21368 [Fusarium oxysporum f. sp. lycopersici 4287]